MTATLSGLNLTKVYDLGEERRPGLDDFSIEVFAGEMVAVVGRTGSGKSTLLHVLGFLQRPDSGQVSIEGVDGARLNEEELGEVRARRVGFVFQAFNLLPNDTAAINVAVALAGEGLSARDSRRKHRRRWITWAWGTGWTTPPASSPNGTASISPSPGDS